jgi:hypothetical protein
MKRLIALMLVIPAIASAQQVFGTFEITSGSFNGQTGVLTLTGPNFSAFGTSSELGPIGSDFFGVPWSATGRLGTGFQWSDGSDGSPLTINVEAGGLGWSIPAGPANGSSEIQFAANPNLIMHGPGTYTDSFTFGGAIYGIPSNEVASPMGCTNVSPCSEVYFNGGGTVSMTFVPYPYTPTAVMLTQVIYTFTAPEASTLSLFVIALGGLGVQTLRRRQLKLQRKYT